MRPINGYTLVGIEAKPVTVEVELVRRLPATVIVGLPAATVKESAERIRSAIESAGFDFPRTRVIVNAAPVDLHKHPAGALDLAIAVAVLVATKQMDPPLPDTAYFGELALSGKVRPLRGSLAVAVAAAHAGQRLITSNLVQIPTLGGLQLAAHGIENLVDVVLPSSARITPRSFEGGLTQPVALDFADLNRMPYPPNVVALDGIMEAVRAKKTLVLVGSTGVGKAAIARRLIDLLPPLTSEEQLEVSCINDAAGLGSSLGGRPFRAPHHSVTANGLIGSASRLGEVTLARHGVLLLDEAHEFQRAAIAGLQGRLNGVAMLVIATNRETTARFDRGEWPALLKNAVRVELEQGQVGGLRWPTTEAIRAQMGVL